MDFINGDCLEEMKKMEDGSIDMIFADFPFNSQDGKEDYVNFVRNCGIQFHRIIKKNSVLVYVNNPANIYKTRNAFEEMTHRDSLVLIRKGALRPAWRFGFQHNCVLTFVNGENVREKWNGTKVNHDKNFLTDVIEYQNGWRGKGKGNWHPQAMPEDLVSKLVDIFSFEGDLVLDPFMGSGTTGVSCKKLKRNFIGIEYYKKYFEMSKNRIENA